MDYQSAGSEFLNNESNILLADHQYQASRNVVPLKKIAKLCSKNIVHGKIWNSKQNIWLTCKLNKKRYGLGNKSYHHRAASCKLC